MIIEKGATLLDYSEEIKIWDSAVIRIVNVRHGLLSSQCISEFFENSAFVFARGKNGKVSIETLSYEFQSNCLLHIAPNQKISISTDENELEYFVVAYHAELYPNAGRWLIADTLRHNLFRKSFVLRTKTPLHFYEQFAAMANEWSNFNPLSLLKIKQRLYSVICALYTELSSEQAVPVDYNSFDYVYQYLQQNYSKPIVIHELSSSLGIARSTIHKQFKDKIGISPQQYLMQLRLDTACKLLASSQMSVDEIAASCGLRDKSYFTRVFKEKYGITPGSYRKQNAFSESDIRRNSIAVSDYKQENYILIESLGRTHRYYEIPKKIVCLDYAAAEMCAALGVADRITGVASAEESLTDCAKEYQDQIAKAPFLPAQSTELNVPSFRAVCDCKPDIVIGTGYSFNRYGGVADAEAFEEKGIHIYAMKATYTLGCSFDSVYGDIQNLGHIFRKEALALKLIEEMKSEETALSEVIAQYESPVRVFSFDTSISGKAITCGQSLENHVISSAGGINVFGDREGQFITVDWQEVSMANPQIILVHCFYSQQDGLQKVALLKQIPEIAETEAMKNDRICLIGVKKVFPGIDNVKTAQFLSEVFHGKNEET